VGRRSSDLISDKEAQVAALAARVAALAETLGVVSSSTIDREGIAAALKGFAALGVGRAFVEVATLPPEVLADALISVLDGIEQSPLPDVELKALDNILGDELLGRLVHASTSSIHRYQTGARATPDPIAARVHFVALVTADLAGSYHALGIRRWFERPRPQLNGTAPADVLAGEWDPEDTPVREVRALAATLIG
jgi:hypothetical protein